jgi:hypothetical protein
MSGECKSFLFFFISGQLLGRVGHIDTNLAAP